MSGKDGTNSHVSVPNCLKLSNDNASNLVSMPRHQMPNPATESYLYMAHTTYLTHPVRWACRSNSTICSQSETFDPRLTCTDRYLSSSYYWPVRGCVKNFLDKSAGLLFPMVRLCSADAAQYLPTFARGLRRYKPPSNLPAYIPKG